MTIGHHARHGHHGRHCCQDHDRDISHGRHGQEILAENAWLFELHSSRKPSQYHDGCAKSHLLVLLRILRSGAVLLLYFRQNLSSILNAAGVFRPLLIRTPAIVSRIIHFNQTMSTLVLDWLFIKFIDLSKAKFSYRDPIKCATDDSFKVPISGM